MAGDDRRRPKIARIEARDDDGDHCKVTMKQSCPQNDDGGHCRVNVEECVVHTDDESRRRVEIQVLDFHSDDGEGPHDEKMKESFACDF